MPNSKNIQAVEALKAKLADAKTIVFADYQGLSVKKIQELRAKVAEASGDLTVAKNTLLRLVLKEKHGDKLDHTFEGPTAVLIAKDDEISPLKALVDFAKTAELPTLKAGILLDKIVTAQELLELAKLPGRLELQAKLVGMLKGPLYGLANVLSGNTRKLVYVLNAISSQKLKVKS